jgi:hypothetical protein
MCKHGTVGTLGYIILPPKLTENPSQLVNMVRYRTVRYAMVRYPGTVPGETQWPVCVPVFVFWRSFLDPWLFMVK